MKEVKKCSISGVAFTMDADAYEALETYLESLKTTYKLSLIHISEPTRR